MKGNSIHTPPKDLFKSLHFFYNIKTVELMNDFYLKVLQEKCKLRICVGEKEKKNSSKDRYPLRPKLKTCLHPYSVHIILIKKKFLRKYEDWLLEKDGYELKFECVIPGK